MRKGRRASLLARKHRTGYQCERTVNIKTSDKQKKSMSSYYVSKLRKKKNSKRETTHQVNINKFVTKIEDRIRMQKQSLSNYGGRCLHINNTREEATSALFLSKK